MNRRFRLTFTLLLLLIGIVIAARYAYAVTTTRRGDNEKFTGAAGIIMDDGSITQSSGDITVGDDLTVTDDAAIGGDATITDDLFISSEIYVTGGGVFSQPVELSFANAPLTMAGMVQPVLIYAAAFDIEEVTMDADTGAGIKIGNAIELAFTGKILNAWVDVTQGCGDSGDTLELWIDNATDASSAVTTLVTAQDCSAASLLGYHSASSTSVPLANVSATNMYVYPVYKDEGNDGNTSTNLQGRLYVQYIKP